jgi:hypothetical protein
VGDRLEVVGASDKAAPGSRVENTAKGMFKIASFILRTQRTSNNRVEYTAIQNQF